MTTLVSVTTKHILLQWACNRHLSMVELPNATRQTGKTEPGDLQGLLLDHSGMEGLSSRIIFESSGLRKQESRPFFGFALWHTVPVAFFEAGFQLQKCSRFWRHGGRCASMERIANAPAQAHSEAAGPSETVPVVP